MAGAIGSAMAAAASAALAAGESTSDGYSPLCQAAAARLLDVLDDDLLIAVVEQLPLPDLLACRAASARCETACCHIGTLQVRWRSELTVGIFRRFSSVRTLEVFDCQASWIPRLAAVLALLPNLTWLFLHQPRDPTTDAPSIASGGLLTDTAVDSLAGALHARACPHLRQLALDERLSDDRARLLAASLPPHAALLLGVAQAHAPVLVSALARGVCANAAFSDGTSALAHAAIHPSPELARALLAHGAVVNAAGPDGATPLIVACNRGHESTVCLLLDARADVNARTLHGTSALHTATYKGHVPVVMRLLGASADVAAACADGMTPLAMAARADRPEIARLLLNAGADAGGIARDGGTPLLAAAYKGHVQVVRVLLEHRAEVNSCRSDGLTALCQASKAGHIGAVQLLLQAGADVEAAGTQYGTTSLLMAAKAGHAGVVQLLLDAGADTRVAGRAYGTTSLIAAAQLGHVEVVQRLLAARADPHQTTHDGSTARQLTERALTALREAPHGNGKATAEGEPPPPAERGGPPSAAGGTDTALATVTASLATLSAAAAGSSASAIDGLPLATRLQKVIHMLEAAERLPKR